MSDAYKEAGVDIDAGNRFIQRIKPLIESTKRRGVIDELGGFGGLFALDTDELKEPVLVAGTDGVGTKLLIAREMNRLDTIGIDLVAMCVNDIACSGARPLFFLDYLATGRLDPEEHVALVEGIAAGCREAKVALIGGETAEMPDVYAEGDFDLAGFAVGVVDRKRIIDGSDIGIGNAIIGIDSTGVHSNGFSLVRRIVRERSLDLTETYDGLERPLGELLLEPTRIYSPLVEQLGRTFALKGIAHITGGGLLENLPRILPAGVQARLDRATWQIPPLFRFLQQQGGIDDEEMLRVFNCGIGLVFAVAADAAEEIVAAIAGSGIGARILGTTRAREAGAPALVCA